MTAHNQTVDVDTLASASATVTEPTRASGYRPSPYRICQETAFLSAAFGSEVLAGEATRDQFLEAFRLDQD